ncbi:MAG: redoxin domain-containing protein [Rhodospirillales bacterium]|nr:redoxin domain-containing protein [Rhodospirillales bacterium]
MKANAFLLAAMLAAAPIDGWGDESRMPPFSGATGWLNSAPLTAAELRGKVVLVEFWTYTCINWLRQLPYVRAWTEKYKPHGLVVIGVHTPEFEFEHNVDSVRRAAREMRITYPIALDNNYAVWRAFSNHAWPALYFVDAQGRIRHHRLGEGDYARSERMIQQLLAEAGAAGVPRDLVSVEGRGIEAAADWASLRSPEIYLGAQHTGNRVNAAAARLRLNQWRASGDWTSQKEAIALHEPNGRIALRFHARDLHLVMGPAFAGSTIRFRVLIDGKPPGAAHGVDIDERGNGTLIEQRLYQLIRQPGPIGDRTFEIEFLDAGAQAFAFTFG